MNQSRRRFLRHGAAAVALGTLAPVAGAAAGLAPVPPDAARRVMDGLARYSKRVSIESVVDGVVKLRATIDDMSAFCDASTRARALPYANVRSEGNLLCFAHEGVSYQLENVLPG